MPGIPQHTIFPIGDSALTIDFGNTISEPINLFVLSLFQEFKNNPLDCIIETVPAYSSITFYYDPFLLRRKVPVGQTAFEWIATRVLERLNASSQNSEPISKLITIPVCYENSFAPDIEHLAREKNISTGELITIHTSRQYRVYMLGFLPGFSYMGQVDEKIATQRKSQPESVAAGSVGIAGRQTGIYPFQSPGGWHIIGRTPLKLFDSGAHHNDNLKPDLEECFCLLHPGDRVQFISISKDEFENY
jgi:inhibitor of KinA